MQHLIDVSGQLHGPAALPLDISSSIKAYMVA